MLGIIGAAAGAAGGILGGLGKNRALKKQINAVKEMQRENQDWYDRRYNEDATQRADAQRVLTMTEEAIKNRNRAAAGSAAVMGGTEESVAAAKEANAKALSDVASQIAIAGEQRKDAIESQYRSKNDALQEQINALKGQKKSGWDIASDAIGGAAEGLFGGVNLGMKGGADWKQAAFGK